MALREVSRAAEDLAAAIDELWEGMGRIIAIAIHGVRGSKPILPSPSRRSGE